MKNIFISLLSVLMVGALFSNIAAAQTGDGIIVATVGINNTKIISQKDRDLVISFDLSNKTGAQPQIKYSVRLTSTSSADQTLFDEKVYDEVISLNENSVINKTVKYSVPNSLPSGSYKVWIDSRNSGGLLLGIALVGEVNVTGEVLNTVELVPGSCYLVVNSDQYSIKQIPIIYPSSTSSILQATDTDITIEPKNIFSTKCEVKSSFSNNQIFTPKFITRSHSIFGELAPTTQVSNENIIISHGNNEVSIALPKAIKPQDYNLELSLVSTDSKITSNTVSFNYILSGETGTIKNTVFDKTFYKAGDTAKLQIFSTQTGTSTIAAVISDDVGICSAPSTNEISNLSVLDLSIPITKDCTNPNAEITLSSNGIVLDSNNFQVATIVSTTTPTTATNSIILIVVLILVALVIGVLVYRMKNSALKVMVFVFVCSAIFLGSGIVSVEACTGGSNLKTYKCKDMSAAYFVSKDSCPHSVCSGNSVVTTYYGVTRKHWYSGLSDVGCSYVTNYCSYGCSSGACISAPPAPAPVITAASNPVYYGKSTTLILSATNDTSYGCTLTGNGSSIFWPSIIGGKSISSGNMTADTPFVLSCSGIGGTGSQTLTITVPTPPFPSITASSTDLSYGASTTISWVATSSPNCSVTKSVGGVDDPSWTVSGTPNTFAYSPDSQTNGTFSRPSGIIVSSGGNINIADSGNNNVTIFNSLGVLIAQIGSSLSGPKGIAIDSGNPYNVYVADTNNNNIKKFKNNSGVFSLDSAFGAFSAPSGITFSSNSIYVSDTGNNRIQKLSLSGILDSSFGSVGSDNGQFNSPKGLAHDSSGNIYVADYGNERIQKFDANGNFIWWLGFDGSTTGTHTSGTAKKGNGTGQFNGPVSVSVDSSGNIYVLNYLNARFQKFDSSGTYLSQFGSLGSLNGQFNGPEGIAVDSSNNVYVADTVNSRVKKFLPQINSYKDSGSLATTTTFTATCSFPATSKTEAVTTSKSVTVLVAPKPAISVVISAAPASIYKNDNTIISWISDGADFCTTTKKEGVGSATFFSAATSSLGISSGQLNSNTVFASQCKNNKGDLANASTTVTVTIPPISIDAFGVDPLFVFKNSTTTISWSSTGADFCTTTQNASGFSPIVLSTTTSSSGTYSKDVVATTTFNTVCKNNNGNTANSSAVVSIITPQTLPITLRPKIYVDDFGITWEADAAESCTAQYNTGSAVTLETVGSLPLGPNGEVPIITCTYGEGSDSFSIELNNNATQDSPVPAIRSTCTPSQNYINRNTVWTTALVNPPAGANITSRTWSGTNIATTTNLESTLNKIYTTVGPKYFRIKTIGTRADSSPFVSICSTTTLMKLDTGGSGEI